MPAPPAASGKWRHVRVSFGENLKNRNGVRNTQPTQSLKFSPVAIWGFGGEEGPLVNDSPIAARNRLARSEKTACAAGRRQNVNWHPPMT